MGRIWEQLAEGPVLEARPLRVGEADGHMATRVELANRRVAAPRSALGKSAPKN